MAILRAHRSARSLRRSAEHLDGHRHDTGVDHVEPPRRGLRDIDDAAVAAEGPSIIDANLHAASVSGVGHAHPGAERQGAVRRGKFVAIEALPRRSRPAVLLLAIERREAALDGTRG